MMEWLGEIAKLGIPIVLGLLVWFAQTMAQRAWNEYEARRGLYQEVVKRIDSLFASDSRSGVATSEERISEERIEYLREIRKVWLIGSDEVVLAANALAASTATGTPDEERAKAYGEFIAAMRCDLRTRRWLPPSRTALDVRSFPVQGAS